MQFSYDGLYWQRAFLRSGGGSDGISWSGIVKSYHAEIPIAPFFPAEHLRLGRGECGVFTGRLAGRSVLARTAALSNASGELFDLLFKILKVVIEPHDLNCSSVAALN
jgi:hypothetical protein